MKKLNLAITVLLTLYFQLLFAQKDTIQLTKVVDLNEVIISANKTEEARKNVAQQIQTLNATQIANSNAQTTADLVGNSPNVAVQRSQLGGGSPVLRGFEANRILLVVDGVRMNNIIYRAGHLQNIISIDNNMLDKVEILFGPSSSIYGSDALGGVIHMYSKKPQFSTDDQKNNIKANALSRFGTAANEFTGHVDFNIGGKKLASISSITYSTFGHLRGGENQNPYFNESFGDREYYVERIDNKDSLVKNSDRYLQVQSGYSQLDLMQKLSFKQNEHLTHGINLQLSNSTDVPRYDRLTDPGSAGLSYAQWYYGPQMRMLAAYDLNRINTSSFLQNIHAGINYQNLEESRHTRRFNSNNLTHRTEKVNVIGANMDLQRIAGKHSIRFGLDGQYNSLESTAFAENISNEVESPLDTRYPDGDNTMSSAALYFSHTWKINDQVTLTDAIRVGFISLYSTFKDTTFFPLPYTKVEQNNAVYSGSIGLIHMPSDDLKLSFLIATGFRAPNVDDLSKVFESAPGNVIVPNNDLKPEKTITTEIGVTRVYEQKTSWENNIYYTDFKDAIVTQKFQFNGQDSIMYDGEMSQVLANQNKRRAYIFGFSSNVKSQWTNNLQFGFGLNYTYGRIKTDSSDYPLDHIPPFMMKLQLNYSHNKFSSDFFVNYNSWKRLKNYFIGGEDNEQYATSEGMPAWFTVNFRMSYKIHKLLTLSAGVDNAFDIQYRTFASGINGPGRNFIAALRFNY